MAGAAALLFLGALGGSSPAPVLAAAAASHSGGLAVAAAPAAPAALTRTAGSSSFALEYAPVNSGRAKVLLRWNPCQTITYKVNVSAVPAARRAAVVQQLQAGVAKLSSALSTSSGRVTFAYRGTTTEVPRTSTIDRQSAELIIAVTTPRSTDVKIGNGVLGYGGYTYWTWSSTSASGAKTYGAAISRGWVVLDVTGFLRLRSGFGAGLTQGNVVLHELAHSMGLDHVRDARQIMYPTLTPSAPSGYGAGDRAGLAKLGRAAGCISVPAGMFTDLR